MMHACDDENPQAERHTKCHRTPHTTTAQRLDEDGKEEVEKPLVSYCKEIVGFESRCFYNLGSRHETPIH